LKDAADQRLHLVNRITDLNQELEALKKKDTNFTNSAGRKKISKHKNPLIFMI